SRHDSRITQRLHTHIQQHGLVMTALFGSVLVLSLVYAVVSTAMSPQFAYFDTFGRLWEFSLGSLLAVWITRLSVSSLIGAILGWVGLAGLVLCGAIINAQDGAAVSLAWWAIASAACVMIGGADAPAGGPARLLTIAPVRFLGRIAYPLYLVHWPILVTWIVLQGRSDVGPLSGLAIVSLSIGVAAAVHYGIERPAAHISEAPGLVRRRVIVIVVSATLVVVPLSSWQLSEQLAIDADVNDETHPGAGVLLSPSPEALEVHPVQPSGAELEEEWVVLPQVCEGRFAPDDALVADNCKQSPTGMVPQPVVMVIGDSHAQQWMGALVPIAQREGWQLVSVLRGGCNLGLDQPGLGDVDACDRWRAAALDYALDVAPAAVMTMGTLTRADSAAERVPDGLARALQTLVEGGVAVLTLRDNPRFVESPFTCVERWGAESGRCDHAMNDKLAPRDPGARLDNLDGVDHLDLTDLLCPDEVCRAVIGNVALYRDDNHLGRTYAESMAGELESRLRGTQWWRALA
ncbi:acyltransferase family protein, partial [Microbacterium aurantiacum]